MSKTEPLEMQIRFAGSGGQGLILSARILAAALAGEGRFVAQSQAYEPTSRGGLSRSDLVISEREVDYPLVTALDVAVILDQVAVPACAGLLGRQTLTIIDAGKVTAPPEEPQTIHALPITETARALGNPRVANITALGALAELAGLIAPQTLRARMLKLVPARFRDINAEAFDAGQALAKAAEKV